jgi:hypothetical protein
MSPAAILEASTKPPVATGIAEPVSVPARDLQAVSGRWSTRDAVLDEDQAAVLSLEGCFSPRRSGDTLNRLLRRRS